nr:helix-turn-helix domain-containing protein [Parabacteroides goldsteinii]
MKAFYLFFFIFIYIGCTSRTQERVDPLDKELMTTPILSLSFDSLWKEVRSLPHHHQVEMALQISNREEEISGMQKQEYFLLEVLPLASKKEKKKILLCLLQLYGKLNEQRVLDADVKGIQISDELETNYSLPREEEWIIKKIKATLLSRKGLHDQYLPIWFELLAEHRAANKLELIIDDLLTIANQFSILGDKERAISWYKDAYQLAIKNHFSELANQCLARLIYLFYDSKRYTEVVNYSNEISEAPIALFKLSIYSILSLSYIELQKPDSARFYLTKMNIGNKMLLNCRIADTYIAESKEDSAAIFLQKAMGLFQKQAKNLREKNIEVFLPPCFLPTYSSLGTLYQQNGKISQAGESFALVEPLMKNVTQDIPQLEKQIDALTRYSSFCRETKQYEKAVNLLILRDSIQQITNNINKERNDKNIMDRLQINDLMHRIKIQEVELMDSHRLLVAFGTCLILFISLVGAVFYIYRQRKKQQVAIFEQKKEAELRQASAIPELKALSPQEKLFQAAQKKVKSGKLYLDKDISLDSLAKILETNRSYLSSSINTCSGKNFNQWINDFRIDYLLERIHSGQKLSTLAEKAGFVSTDSFYRNFKRKTNLTPSEYLKQNPPSPPTNNL